MKKLEPIKQQELISSLGGKKARRACLPTCFFILAKANGYFDESLSLEKFVSSLDWQNNFSAKMGWLRAKLSSELRRQYGLKIISWQLLQKGLPGILARRRMKKAGYFNSAKEWRFFKKTVAGKSAFELTKNGFSVIVTVLPGFDDNKDVHAVILNGYKDGKVNVVDPNANNNKEFYTEDELRRVISPLGAASIVLPK